MTRQQIDHGKYQISIGWDRAFDTYFAQVENTEDDLAEEPLLWLGSEPGEYRELKTFRQSLAKELQAIGINDFELDSQQLKELQANRNENPPGVGIAEKSPAICDLMNLLTER